MKLIILNRGLGLISYYNLRVEDAFLIQASPTELGFGKLERANPESDILFPADMGFTTNLDVQKKYVEFFEHFAFRLECYEVPS